jgi:uncharacterized protein
MFGVASSTLSMKCGCVFIAALPRDSSPVSPARIAFFVRGRYASRVPVRIAVLLALLAGCSRSPVELRLPDVRQATGYTCGVAALQAVLTYYGVEMREDRLARELGADPQAGVPPPAIARVARAHGVRAEIRERMTVDELVRLVRAGRPVIIVLQAWADRHRGYASDWEDGHYLVLIGAQGDQLIFEDPSLLGSRGVLRRRELEERWHDTDGKHAWLQAGVVFDGRPAPPPARRHID